MEQAELAIKYDGYIRRQEEEARKLKKYEGMLFPADFPFATARGLSARSGTSWPGSAPRPSAGAAGPGVTPAAVALLLVLLRRRRRGPSVGPTGNRRTGRRQQVDSDEVSGMFHVEPPR